MACVKRELENESARWEGLLVPVTSLGTGELGKIPTLHSRLTLLTRAREAQPSTVSLVFSLARVHVHVRMLQLLEASQL